MTLKEYQLKAAETAIYPKDRSVEYLTLGLCGEVGELLVYDSVLFDNDFKDGVVKELGDCAWYLAGLSEALHRPIVDDEKLIRFSRYARGNACLYGLVSESAKLANLVKKTIRDGGSAKGTEILDNCWLRFAEICHVIETPVATVLEINIAKLADRKARNVLQGSGDYR